MAKIERIILGIAVRNANRLRPKVDGGRRIKAILVVERKAMGVVDLFQDVAGSKVDFRRICSQKAYGKNQGSDFMLLLAGTHRSRTQRCVPGPLPRPTPGVHPRASLVHEVEQVSEPAMLNEGLLSGRHPNTYLSTMSVRHTERMGVEIAGGCGARVVS